MFLHRIEGGVRDAVTLARSGARVQRVEGVLKGTDRRLSVAFVGVGDQLRDFHDFFAAPPTPAGLDLSAPDLALVTEPLPFPLKGTLRGFPFLDAVLDVRPSLAEQVAAVRSKAHRRRLRHAQRSAKLQFTVRDDLGGVEAFFHQLHAPYLEARFGERRVHTPLAVLLAKFAATGGHVVTVTEKGEPVAGALLYRHGAGLDYDRNGFRLDSLASPLKLAQRTAALELAVFTLAQEVRARHLLLGYCRAFLDDGLFTHKRRLGCRFQPARASTAYHLWCADELKPALFGAAPMVLGEPRALDAHVGLTRGASGRSAADWRVLLKNFAAPQVHRAVVWTDLPEGDPAAADFTHALERVFDGRPIEWRRAGGAAS